MSWWCPADFDISYLYHPPQTSCPTCEGTCPICDIFFLAHLQESFCLTTSLTSAGNNKTYVKFPKCTQGCSCLAAGWVGVPPGAGERCPKAIIHDPTLYSAVETHVACVGRDQGALDSGTDLQGHAGEGIKQGNEEK